MKGVHTRYKINGRSFGSYILADSMNEAILYRSQRNLKEVIDSQLMNNIDPVELEKLPDNEFIDKLPDVIHSTTFISFVALSSGSVSVESILGDYGILHELIHLQADVKAVDNPSIKELKAKIVELKEKTAGF